MKTFIKNFPLLLAYCIYPLVNIVLRINNVKIVNQWIDISWIILLIVTISLLPFKRKNPKVKLTKNWPLLVIITITYIIIKILQLIYAINHNSFSVIPFLMEMKPLFYLFFSLLWFYIFGLPSEKSFKYFGLVLSIIFIADFLIEGLILNQGIMRVRGSGEPNYDAMLLGISYILSINEFDIANLVILVGIAATFSRTSILAILVVILLFQKISFQKFVILATGSLILAYTFIVRNLSFEIQTMDRFWMWKTLGDVIKTNGVGLLFGFPIGIRLPFTMPLNLRVLWTSQEYAWGLTGIFPYNFHSMWIRFILSLGLPFVVILVILSCIYLLKYKNDHILIALLFFILIEGLSMGVFYLSNVGIPCITALFLLNRERITVASNRKNVILPRVYAHE
jgi:hypothetical protein